MGLHFRVDDGHFENSIEEEKQALRQIMRRRLAGLDPSARRACSAGLIEQLTALPIWQRARRVLLFAPMPSEPDMDRLWLGGHLEDKECVYPRVVGHGLALYRVDELEELRPAPPWNLREPVPHSSKRVSIEDVDLMLVPGLAFDARGGRLGRGGGFYDRLLATRQAGRPYAVGVCFEFQRQERLPLAPHDALLDGLIVG